MKLSKLATAVSVALVAQAASAGVITVIIDDFSVAASGAANSNRTMNFTFGTGSSTIGSDGIYPSSPFLNVSVGATPVAGATFQLGYDGFSLPTGATAGTVTFAALFNGVSGSLGNTAGNTVGLTSPTGTALTTVTDFSLLTPLTTVGTYTGGAFNVVFNSPATRAWDILVDNIGASFNCSTVVGNTTVSLSQFSSSAFDCNAKVPVPGSLALLGLGGIALGLVARRRSIK